MRRNAKSILIIIMSISIFMLVANSLLMGPVALVQNACAPTREFEENITISSNEFASLELAFVQGEELELIFTVAVEQDLPIDVWFVNYANYVRLVDSNEFLFFIDGSASEITQASKIVSVTQYGTYLLVLSNYNNVSVDVNLVYDVNVYPEEAPSKDSEKEASVPLWKEPYVMLPLGLVIGIVVGLFVSRLAGISKKDKKKKGKKKSSKANQNAPSKKTKKKVKASTKKASPIAGKENKSKEEELDKTKDDQPEAKKEAIPQFCGHCGKPVETPFCPFCGKAVNKS